MLRIAASLDYQKKLGKCCSVGSKLTGPRKAITDAYTELRSKEDMKTLPITPRTLETMIRLAEAHAKCRLRNEVTEDDAKVAFQLMEYALYHEEANPRTKHPPTTHTSIPVDTTPEDKPMDVQQEQEQDEDNIEDAHLHRNAKRRKKEDIEPVDLLQECVSTHL